MIKQGLKSRFKRFEWFKKEDEQPTVIRTIRTLEGDEEEVKQGEGL